MAVYRNIRLILAWVAACAGGIAFSQEPVRIDLEEISTITLDSSGSAVVSISVPQTAIIRPDIFSATPGAEPLAFRYTNPEINPIQEFMPHIPMSSTIVEAGDYEITLQSNYSGDTPAEVQVRFSLEPPLDNFEPNDTMETATQIDLPFIALIDLGDGGQDWFRVRAPAGAVIGTHLMARWSHYGYFISYYDADGVLLYRTINEEWGVHGARYFESDGRDLFIQVVDESGYRDPENRSYEVLEIAAYLPSGHNPNAFVKIAMGADEESSRQADFIGGASGTRVADATESIDITEELIRTVEERKSFYQSPSFIAAMLCLVLSASLIGWQVSKNRRARSS